MGDMLFMAHSGVRYLVLLAGVSAALLAALSLRGGVLSGPGEVAGRVYIVTLDIQLVLGLATLLTRPFYPALIGHLVLMVAGLVVAHAVWVSVKRRPRGARPAGRQLAGVAGSLLLIVAGILAIGRPIV